MHACYIDMIHAKRTRARGYSHGLGSDKGSSEDQNRSRGIIELNTAAILVSHRNPDHSEDYGRLWLVNIIQENKVKIMRKKSILSLLWIKTNLA